MAKVTYYAIVDKRGGFLSREHFEGGVRKYFSVWTPLLSEAMLFPKTIIENLDGAHDLGVEGLEGIAAKVDGTLVEISMDYFVKRHDDGRLVATVNQEDYFADSIGFLGGTGVLRISRSVF